MKLHYNKYITLLLLCCFLGSDLIHAQEKNAQQGEIVMTQSELDSLLLKIVRHKREQMAKERAYRYVATDKGIDTILQARRTTMSVTPMDQSKQYGNSFNEERILNEFARLNNRIDGLILNFGSRGVSSVPPRQTYSAPGGGDPNVFYMQPGNQSQQPTLAPGYFLDQTDQGTKTADGKVTERVITESSEDQDSVKPTEESLRMQNQITDLTEKVRVLDRLSEATQSKEYDDEISELNTEIQTLRSKLAESDRAAAEEMAKREKSQLDSATLKELREYDLRIYFANNSTSLGNTDRIALEELARLIKKYEDHLTVVLHGFASKSGTAAYNNKISFERAEAVKKVLRANGIRARNIVTLPHGVDDTGNADMARRVEISLQVM